MSLSIFMEDLISNGVGTHAETLLQQDRAPQPSIALQMTGTKLVLTTGRRVRIFPDQEILVQSLWQAQKQQLRVKVPAFDEI